MQGCFITFEGGEGAGKSTQINLLAKHFHAIGLDVVVTREPGGTKGAEAVRHVLLSGAAEAYGLEFEAFLFASARADHIEQLIAPAIKAGKFVLCDRFIDSTRVYQAGKSEKSKNTLSLLEKIAINGFLPDITFILDIPAKFGMERATNRRKDGENIDRFEKDTLEIQEQRRQDFLHIAKNEPRRCHVIDATQSIAKISKDIIVICNRFIENRQNDRL